MKKKHHLGCPICGAHTIKGWVHKELAIYTPERWISGFTGTSSAYIVDGDGRYIQTPNKNYKQVTLSNATRICHNNTWQYFVAS